MVSPVVTHMAVLAEHAQRIEHVERHPGHCHAAAARRAQKAHPSARRAELRRGARAMVPFLVGYIPFGLVIGSTVRDGGPVLARWAGTVLIMGGSAQLAVLQLLDAGAAVAVAVATGLVVHARLLVYSASLAPEWADASRRFKLAAALGVIDPTWAVARQRVERGGPPSDRRAYYAGAALLLCTGWLALISLGTVVGGLLDLDAAAVAVPLCLLTLVLPRLASRTGRALVGAAGAAAWFGAALPAGTGIMLAVACGVAVAMAAERREARA